MIVSYEVEVYQKKKKLQLLKWIQKMHIFYDDEFKQSLIAKIEEIKNSIIEGDFYYDDSDEDQCKWCEFGLMCNIKQGNKK